MKMRGILASFLLLALLVPPSQGGDAVPPVENVTATGTGTVTWDPPEMPAADLAQASYIIYGKNLTTGAETELGTQIPMVFAAQVTAGYDAYGVAVRVGAETSVKVYQCVALKMEAPYVDQRCFRIGT